MNIEDLLSLVEEVSQSYFSFDMPKLYRDLRELKQALSKIDDFIECDCDVQPDPQSGILEDCTKCNNIGFLAV